MTEEEYAAFAPRLSAYNMSQAEFIRQAIARVTIRPIVTVSPVNDELLSAVGYSCLSQVFTKLATTHDINNTTNINIYKRKRRCLIAPPLSILNTNY